MKISRRIAPAPIDVSGKILRVIRSKDEVTLEKYCIMYIRPQKALVEKEAVGM
jgi:hypothetical protein